MADAVSTQLQLSKIQAAPAAVGMILVRVRDNMDSASLKDCQEELKKAHDIIYAMFRAVMYVKNLPSA